MGVNTLKFSQFSTPQHNTSDIEVVGLEVGANIITNYQIRWTTATRPISPFDGVLGYNTDLHVYEYWNSLTSTWKTITAT